MNSDTTILLVDDTREINDASTRVLRSVGYNVIQAFNAQQCLQIMKTCMPDLMLIDVVMEGMNGVDLCRFIKSSPEFEYPHIILLSGLRVSSDYQSEGLEAGADGYIPRPVQNRELLARVDAAVRIIKAEKELRASLERSKVLENQLVSLNATKDKFFSIIAHDLKNPFFTILGFSELLRDNIGEFDKSKTNECLAILADSSKQAYELLENLLMWSMSQTDSIDFNPEMINLRESVSDSINLVLPQANAKGIVIVSDIINEIGITADKNMISTVLRNLLSNAIKFTPRNGRISITVNLSKSEVEIAVSDNGVGIPEKDIDWIFKVEEKISTAGTEKEKGTGLGLVLCREFIEKHRGRIWAESEEGKGSRFLFTIPINAC